MSDIEETYDDAARPVDAREVEATERLGEFFDQNREQVFFSRQLEVLNEDEYFHWITNRSIRILESLGVIKSEWRRLKTGTQIKLVWHRSYRFYRRGATKLVSLVEEYADPNIGAAIGLHGEAMVLEGFATAKFLMQGRDASEYAGREWTESGHNLDFIFERDGVAYGVEVKNTLGYMDDREFLLKIRLCTELGVRPVFVCRMLPKTWIYKLSKAGGFALILKYQLYPWTHRELAKRVKSELGLPVDAPRRFAEGTMKRFLKWHVKNM